jgi:hypothetical protein
MSYNTNLYSTLYFSFSISHFAISQKVKVAKTGRGKTPTAGLNPAYSKHLNSIPIQNTVTIVDYILSMKTDIFLHDTDCSHSNYSCILQPF